MIRYLSKCLPYSLHCCSGVRKLARHPAALDLMTTLNRQGIIKSLLSSTYLCIRRTSLEETEAFGDIGVARARWKLSSDFEDLYFGLGHL